MTSIWMGLTTLAEAKDRVEFTGSKPIHASMQSWLGLSPFAVHKKLAS
jgi:hypothetical protein